MIELVRTDGLFELDGGSWEVTNNIWLVGDDREVIVIDAAHDAQVIIDALHGRKLRNIALTHGHNDHINVAVELREATDAPIFLHPDDAMLWEVVYPNDHPDGELADGLALDVNGLQLRVLHTPGHSPGACCFELSMTPEPIVFTGDTLFCGGPGATGRSFSDYPTILRSIASRLLVLSDDTVVHTGHGESTTVGIERKALEDLVQTANLG